MNRWMSRWNAFWFPEDNGVRLGVCRIIIAVSQLVLFFPSLEANILKAKLGGDFVDPQVLIVAVTSILPKGWFPTPHSLEVIYWATATAGITTIVGVLTRGSAFVFALGNWIFVSHKYSYGDLHHGEAILCIFLMMLAFSPSGRCLSIDALIRRFRATRLDSPRETTTTAIWPLKLTQVLLCWAYLSNGVCKLAFGGLRWMNGYTLQGLVFSDAIKNQKPFGLWLAQNHTLCLWLSIGTILFELFFFISFFVPRTLPYFLVGGALLHIGIYATMDAPFFEYIVLYSVFLNFAFFERSMSQVTMTTCLNPVENENLTRVINLSTRPQE